MNNVIIKANEIISAKTNYVGGGMEGYAVLTLLDDKGYPTSGAITISQADGINWLTFATSPDSNKARRIAKSNKACVCIASPEYNISLVGTAEEVTDLEEKKKSWCELMNGGPHWTGYDDPRFYVIRFKTERYNICFAEDDSEAVGNL